MSRTYVGFKHIHLISQNSGKNFKKISGAFLFSLSVVNIKASVSLHQRGVIIKCFDIIFCLLVLVTAASVPLDFGVVDVSTTAIELSWQPGIGDFTNYLVTYSPVGPITPAAKLVSKTDPRVIRFTGLTPGTLHLIKVIQQGGTVQLENTIMKSTRKFLSI